MAIRNRDVLLEVGSIEVNTAQGTRVAAHEALPCALPRHIAWSAGVKPASPHVIQVVHRVDDHPMTLHRTCCIGHAVEPQPRLLKHAGGQATSGARRGAPDARFVLPQGGRREVAMPPLVIDRHHEQGAPAFAL